MSANDRIRISDMHNPELPPDIWGRIASFAATETDVWSLTGTCRSARLVRNNPSLQAAWLLRSPKYGSRCIAVSLQLPDSYDKPYPKACKISGNNSSRSSHDETGGPLAAAAYGDDAAIAVLAHLLRSGADPNQLQRPCSAPGACLFNSTAKHAITGDVLELGRFPSIQAANPLILACCVPDGQRCLAAVELLLAHGASPHVRDEYGYTPLHYAACTARFRVAAALIRAGADVNAAAAADHLTPLLIACGACPDGIIHSLLVAAAQARFPRHSSRPQPQPTSSRPCSGDAAAGACSDAHHAHDSSSGSASSGGYDDQAALRGTIIPASQPAEPLTITQLQPQIQGEETPSSQPPQPLLCYDQTTGHLTPHADSAELLQVLYQQRLGGCGRTVRLLLASGADVTARDHMSNTALMMASMDGLTEAAACLLDAGADPNAANIAGDHALLMAAMGGPFPEVTRLLLKHGARPNALGSRGCAALHVAAFYGHADTIRALIDGGADTEVLDANGRTPLFWAAARWQVAACGALLRSGADAWSVIMLHGMAAGGGGWQAAAREAVRKGLLTAGLVAAGAGATLWLLNRRGRS